MIKIPIDQIRELEKAYPGITESIYYFDTLPLPSCPLCNSHDTAFVIVGAVGRSINIACTTTKATLITNRTTEGKYRCNACKKYFDDREVRTEEVKL